MKRHNASSKSTIPSKRSCTTSAGNPVQTLKCENIPPPKLMAFITRRWAERSSSVLLHNVSWVWYSSFSVVQNLQTYFPEKFSTNPAILWALRLSATKHWTVFFTVFPSFSLKSLLWGDFGIAMLLMPITQWGLESLHSQCAHLSLLSHLHGQQSSSRVSSSSYW